MKNILLVLLIALGLSLCNLSERFKKGSSNSGPTAAGGSSRSVETGKANGGANCRPRRRSGSEVGQAGNVVDHSAELDRGDERVEDVCDAFAGWWKRSFTHSQHLADGR